MNGKINGYRWVLYLTMEHPQENMVQNSVHLFKRKQKPILKDPIDAGIEYAGLWKNDNALKNIEGLIQIQKGNVQLMYFTKRSL